MAPSRGSLKVKPNVNLKVMLALTMGNSGPQGPVTLGNYGAVGPCNRWLPQVTLGYHKLQSWAVGPCN